MNCHEVTPLLDEYVDGTSSGLDRARVDAHLMACTTCQSLVDDFRAIRSAARTLEPHLPPPHVWHRIAAASQTRAPLLSFAFARSAAALVMVTVIAVGLWRIGTMLGPVTQVAVIESPDSEEAHYTAAIARLEEAASAERDTLDPETVGAMDAGLTVINRAITESRAALKSTPDSELAQQSLFEAMRHKVTVLQDMVALINEMRKGNETAAARIVSEMNQ